MLNNATITRINVQPCYPVCYHPGAPGELSWGLPHPPDQAWGVPWPSYKIPVNVLSGTCSVFHWERLANGYNLGVIRTLQRWKWATGGTGILFHVLTHVVWISLAHSRDAPDTVNKELSSLLFHGLYSTESCIAFELGLWISQRSKGERATLQELLEY